jgi:hypothetical protein
MFILVSGAFPFNGTGEKIYDVISTGDYTVCHVLSAKYSGREVMIEVKTFQLKLTKIKKAHGCEFS